MEDWQSGLLQFFAKEYCLKYGNTSSNLVSSAISFIKEKNMGRGNAWRVHLICNEKFSGGRCPDGPPFYGEVAE